MPGLVVLVDGVLLSASSRRRHTISNDFQGFCFVALLFQHICQSQSCFQVIRILGSDYRQFSSLAVTPTPFEVINGLFCFSSLM